MTASIRQTGIVVAWLLVLLAGSSNAQELQPVSPQALNAILAEPLGTPGAGSVHGDVTVVEYFDYNCPGCRHLEPQLRKLIAGDPKVRLVRKDWPVFGDASVYAAYCSFAAARDGQYAAVHDALIGSRRDLDSKQHVQQVLRDAGVDVQRIEADIVLHQADYAAVLARNEREAAQLGLRGTPGLIVGHQRVPGGLDSAQLERLVARARQAP